MFSNLFPPSPSPNQNNSNSNPQNNNPTTNFSFFGGNQNINNNSIFDLQPLHQITPPISNSQSSFLFLQHQCLQNSNNLGNPSNRNQGQFLDSMNNNTTNLSTGLFQGITNSLNSRNPLNQPENLNNNNNQRLFQGLGLNLRNPLNQPENLNINNNQGLFQGLALSKPLNTKEIKEENIFNSNFNEKKDENDKIEFYSSENNSEFNILKPLNKKKFKTIIFNIEIYDIFQLQNNIKFIQSLNLIAEKNELILNFMRFNRNTEKNSLEFIYYIKQTYENLLFKSLISQSEKISKIKSIIYLEYGNPIQKFDKNSLYLNTLFLSPPYLINALLNLIVKIPDMLSEIELISELYQLKSLLNIDEIHNPNENLLKNDNLPIIPIIPSYNTIYKTNENKGYPPHPSNNLKKAFVQSIGMDPAGLSMNEWRIKDYLLLNLNKIKNIDQIDLKSKKEKGTKLELLKNIKNNWKIIIEKIREELKENHNFLKNIIINENLTYFFAKNSFDLEKYQNLTEKKEIKTNFKEISDYNTLIDISNKIESPDFEFTFNKLDSLLYFVQKFLDEKSENTFFFISKKKVHKMLNILEKLCLYYLKSQFSNENIPLIFNLLKITANLTNYLKIPLNIVNLINFFKMIFSKKIVDFSLNIIEMDSELTKKLMFSFFFEEKIFKKLVLESSFENIIARDFIIKALKYEEELFFESKIEILLFLISKRSMFFIEKNFLFNFILKIIDVKIGEKMKDSLKNDNDFKTDIIDLENLIDILDFDYPEIYQKILEKIGINIYWKNLFYQKILEKMKKINNFEIDINLFENEKNLLKTIKYNQNRIFLNFNCFLNELILKNVVFNELSLENYVNLCREMLIFIIKKMKLESFDTIFDLIFVTTKRNSKNSLSILFYYFEKIVKFSKIINSKQKNSNLKTYDFDYLFHIFNELIEIIIEIIIEKIKEIETNSLKSILFFENFKSKSLHSIFFLILEIPKTLIFQLNYENHENRQKYILKYMNFIYYLLIKIQAIKKLDLSQTLFINSVFLRMISNEFLEISDWKSDNIDQNPFSLSKTDRKEEFYLEFKKNTEEFLKNSNLFISDQENWITLLTINKVLEKQQLKNNLIANCNEFIKKTFTEGLSTIIAITGIKNQYICEILINLNDKKEKGIKKDKKEKKNSNKSKNLDSELILKFCQNLLENEDFYLRNSANFNLSYLVEILKVILNFTRKNNFNHILLIFFEILKKLNFDFSEDLLEELIDNGFNNQNEIELLGLYLNNELLKEKEILIANSAYKWHLYLVKKNEKTLEISSITKNFLYFSNLIEYDIFSIDFLEFFFENYDNNISNLFDLFKGKVFLIGRKIIFKIIDFVVKFVNNEKIGIVIKKRKLNYCKDLLELIHNRFPLIFYKFSENNFEELSDIFMNNFITYSNDISLDISFIEYSNIMEKISCSIGLSDMIIKKSFKKIQENLIDKNCFNENLLLKFSYIIFSQTLNNESLLNDQLFINFFFEKSSKIIEDILFYDKSDGFLLDFLSKLLILNIVLNKNEIPNLEKPLDYKIVTFFLHLILEKLSFLPEKVKVNNEFTKEFEYFEKDENKKINKNNLLNLDFYDNLSIKSLIDLSSNQNTNLKYKLNQINLIENSTIFKIEPIIENKEQIFLDIDKFALNNLFIEKYKNTKDLLSFYYSKIPLIKKCPLNNNFPSLLNPNNIENNVFFNKYQEYRELKLLENPINLDLNKILSEIPIEKKNFLLTLADNKTINEIKDDDKLVNPAQNMKVFSKLDSQIFKKSSTNVKNNIKINSPNQLSPLLNKKIMNIIIEKLSNERNLIRDNSNWKYILTLIFSNPENIKNFIEIFNLILGNDTNYLEKDLNLEKNKNYFKKVKSLLRNILPFIDNIQFISQKIYQYIRSILSKSNLKTNILENLTNLFLSKKKNKILFFIRINSIIPMKFDLIQKEFSLISSELISYFYDKLTFALNSSLTKDSMLFSLKSEHKEVLKLFLQLEDNEKFNIYLEIVNSIISILKTYQSEYEKFCSMIRFRDFLCFSDSLVIFVDNFCQLNQIILTKINRGIKYLNKLLKEFIYETTKLFEEIRFSSNELITFLLLNSGLKEFYLEYMSLFATNATFIEKFNKKDVYMIFFKLFDNILIGFDILKTKKTSKRFNCQTDGLELARADSIKSDPMIRPGLIKQQSNLFETDIKECFVQMENNMQEIISKFYLNGYKNLKVIEKMDYIRQITNKKLVKKNKNVDSRRILLNIRRDNIWFSTIKEIITFTPEDMLVNDFEIKFVNEEGIDAGGLRKEWLTLLFKEIFDPEKGFFELTPNKLSIQPSQFATLIPDYKIHFRLLGRLVSKCIFSRFSLDMDFSKTFLKHILKKRLNLNDMNDFDGDLYRTLMNFLKSDELSGFEGLYFVYNYENKLKNEFEELELIPGGSNIAISNENKRSFIFEYANMKLTYSIKKPMKYFIKGFYDLMPKSIRFILDEKDLGLILSGNKELDIVDMKAHTKFINCNENLIQYFWDYVMNLDNERRSKLIFFITGSFRPPLGGFENFKITIKCLFDNSKLPIAHTCSNTLELPNYESKIILQNKLDLAIDEGGEGSGFHLA